jgi:tetratricopeptide (TPR) repeat protein
MTAGRQDDAVEREYQALLAADPSNVDLKYLTGRVTQDLDRSVALCREAADANPPCAFALYTMCNYALGIGDFREAAARGRKAAELLPQQTYVQWYYEWALLAGGDLGPALKVATQMQEQPFPANLQGYIDEAYIHGLTNRPDRAVEAINRCVEAVTPVSKPFADLQRKRLEAAMAYVAGKPAEYASILTGAADDDDHFAANIATGDIAAAEKNLRPNPEDWHSHLLLYIAYTRVGNAAAKADAQLRAATDALARGDTSDRAYAAALRGHPSAKPLDELLRLWEVPQNKAVLLIALGLHDPAAKDKAFALARRLNFDRRFPYLTLKQALESSSGQAGAH